MSMKNCKDANMCNESDCDSNPIGLTFFLFSVAFKALLLEGTGQHPSILDRFGYLAPLALAKIKEPAGVNLCEIA